jgi:hypothetical protein
MGSVSAMDSIARVIERHGNELITEVWTDLPPEIKAIEGVKVVLGNNIYEIEVYLEFPSSSVMNLQSYDIDTLDERYPDCEIGY